MNFIPVARFYPKPALILNAVRRIGINSDKGDKHELSKSCDFFLCLAFVILLDQILNGIRQVR